MQPALKQEQGMDMIKVAVGELSKQLTNEAIAELSKKYMVLKINGLEDKAGYETVHRARMDVKNRRVAVEHKRKELKEDALRFGKAVDAEANRIKALLEPIESHLEAEQTAIDQEKARIAAEKTRIEQERVQARVNRLYELGCRFDGQKFSLPYAPEGFSLPHGLVKAATDEQFDTFCAKLQELVDAENARLAEIERLRKEEEARLARVKEEQEAEARRLKEEQDRIRQEAERVKAEAEAAERKLREEREALEREKRAIEEAKLKEWREKQRQEELEQARKEATAKARNEMLLEIGYQYPFDDLGEMPDSQWSAMYSEHKKAWDEKQNAIFIAKLKEEKAAREKAEAQEAARQEALRPDKEKLLKLAEAIESMELPKLKNKKTIAILTAVKDRLNDDARFIREEVGQLTPRKGAK